MRKKTFERRDQIHLLLTFPVCFGCLIWPQDYVLGVYSNKYYLVETVDKASRLALGICSHPGGGTRLAVYKTEAEAKELVALVKGKSTIGLIGGISFFIFPKIEDNSIS